MERLYMLYSTDTIDVSLCISILYISPVFPLGVRNRSTTSVKRPLFPLCVCIEIVPHNPIGVFILIRQAPDIHLYNILATYYPGPFFCANFRQFCRFLEQMKTNDTNPETLVVRCVLFAYALIALVSGTGP